MLAGFHFGVDDPLYHSQLFDIRAPHLALIRHPSNFRDSDYFFWLLPENNDGDFPPISSETSNGLGAFDVDFCDYMRGYWRDLLRRYKDARQDEQQLEEHRVDEDKRLVRDNPFLEVFVIRMKSLILRLPLPATYHEAAIVWCMAQRIMLEMEARLT